MSQGSEKLNCRKGVAPVVGVPGTRLKGLTPDPVEEVPRVWVSLIVESRLALWIETRRATMHHQPTSSKSMTKHSDEGNGD